MNSKERIQSALNHKSPDVVPIDFGSTAVTGIHCKVIEGLRDHYNLDKKPVQIIDPFQMLGKVDDELAEIIGVDTIGIYGKKNMFDTDETQLHEQTTPWGQQVLISKDIDLTTDEKGDVYLYAKGDKSFPASAIMPSKCYFVNAIERQQYVDDNIIKPEDNLEEYGPISDDDLSYLTNQINDASKQDKAVVASFGGTALGDIAFIPGMGLKEPKGIRNVSEWYMSTIMRQDFIHEMFDKQIDIAIENYAKLWESVGSKVDVVLTCGTDFGTQDSQFCSPETYMELWHPYYKRMNDWIHNNTTWKVMKHCCGSIIPLLPSFIESGFDAMNPVQINAKDMDSKFLKKEFGKDLVFWGGGIDTQRVLPKGTPQEVKDHVVQQCEILGENGGFVFNAVHNIQANAPLENVIAMIEALQELRNI